MRTYLTILISLLLLNCEVSQAQRFALRRYTAADGLPQSQVNAIAEDHNGYLWLGTSGGGLARFDGHEFVVYSTLDGLLSNVVTSLFIDSHQNLWIVHPRGMTRYDGMHFKRFQPGNTHDALRRVRKVVEFNDTIFMVSNPGMIGKIHGDSIYYWSQRIRPNKSIYFTHVTSDKQICYYLSDSSFMMPSVQGYRVIPHRRYFNKVYSMFNFGKEVILDTDSGSYAFEPVSGVFTRRKKLIDRYIITYDAVSEAYWTRNERTLFREKIVNGTIERDTVLTNVPVLQLLIDTEGNTWFGTAGSGLYRYYARDFEKIKFPQNVDVKAVAAETTGQIWVGGSGLWRFDGRKFKSYPLTNQLDDGVRGIRTSPDNEVWVASYAGLGRYNPVRDSFIWYSRQDGLSSSYITTLDFDDANNIWIGTVGGGLNRFDGRNFTTPGNQDLLQSRSITSICYSNKLRSVFAGTDYGIYQWKNDSTTAISVPEFENTSITSLSMLNDTLLLAGSGGAGLAVINPKGSKVKIIGPHEGLPSGFVSFVAGDVSGYFWVGTEKGITRMLLDEKLEIRETRDFGFDNGLEGIETNENAAHIASNVKLFGLIDGLYRFNGSGSEGIRSYHVHLTDIQLRYGEEPSRSFGKKLEGFFKIPGNPEFPSSLNHVTFFFNRVDKRYPQAVRYRYFMKNFDGSWSQPTSTERVTYSNLPPGDYVFQVVATDSRGSWDNEPLMYAFSIRAPFYQTATFYLLTISLIGGSLVLYILMRMRRNMKMAIEREHIRQQEQASLRKEIARDFHDEMGNQLTRIINYVSLMRLGDKAQGSPDLYHKVEEAAKYLYNGTRDFIWAIDPVNDNLHQLFLHIRDFGEKLFEEKQIRFRAFNEVRDDVKLPYGFSREANLIFKEAMTNAFRHAAAHNVSISLRKLGEGYELTLEDDGIGFDPDKIKLSNGIRNIRSRAEKIQSSLVIEPVSGSAGTRVILRFNNNKTIAYDARNKKTRADRRG